MNEFRICTVVIGGTLDEFLSNLEQIQKISDFIELRVDYIHDLNINDIETIKDKIIKKAIFTCRKSDEGGRFSGSDQERKAIIEKAVQLGFDYIDIEISSAHMFDFGKFKNTMVILSFHEFEKTSSLEELVVVKRTMKYYPGSIMKFASLVQDDNDSKTLLKLLLDKKSNEEMIIIGMGEKGKILRILAPLLGSFCTFASTNYGESAPGQIDIEELNKIYKFLNV